MKTPDILPRLAVFIDAENVGHPSYIDLVFDKIATAKLGTPEIRRAYGNFEGRGPDWRDPWTAKCKQFDVDIIPQKRFVKGKGSADAKIIVDAMRTRLCARRKRIDGFCFVSSDTDFQPLVEFIATGGRKVYGFGKDGTPAALRDAYPDGFFSFKGLRAAARARLLRKSAVARAVVEVLNVQDDWMPVTSLLRELHSRIDIPNGFYLLPFLKLNYTVFEVKSGPQESYADSSVRLLDVNLG